MLYLINALGGFGRSVTESARLAFSQGSASSRWRKFALYAAMFALPGGSLAVVAMVWAQSRRAKKAAAAAVPATPALLPAPAVTANATNSAPPAAQTCGGAQPACRAACGTSAITSAQARPVAGSVPITSISAAASVSATAAARALHAVSKTGAVEALGRMLPMRRHRRNDA